jgi:uncharacterized membrane protein HdeD (DUF308 family)
MKIRSLLSEKWIYYTARGIIAICFGSAAFFYPKAALAVVIFFFGLYAFILGIFSLVSSMEDASRKKKWGLHFLEAVSGITIGLITFFNPNSTAYALIYMISIWAIISGIMEMVEAIRLRKQIKNEILLIAAGILSIILGIVVFNLPEKFAAVIIYMLGFYSIIFGILQLLLGARLKKWTTQEIKL